MEAQIHQANKMGKNQILNQLVTWKWIQLLIIPTWLESGVSCVKNNGIKAQISNSNITKTIKFFKKNPFLKVS